MAQSATSPAKEWPLEAERTILADACVPGRHASWLWNFVRFAGGYHYKCQEPGRRYWLTKRVHKALFDDLGARIDAWKHARFTDHPQPLKVAIVLFRGGGKTNTLTTILPEALSLGEPNFTAAIGSSTAPDAREFLAQIKPILNGADQYSRFSWFYGNWYHPERKWSADAIETAYRTALAAHEPSISTFGVETGITGQHPLFCGFDDPLSQEKLNDGGVWNQKANKSLDSIQYAFVPETFFLLVGTRYLENDPIGTSLRTVGVASWWGHPPVEQYPENPDGYHVYHLQARDIANTSRYEKGEPTLPEAGLTDEYLTFMERRNPITYAAQMMNNPRAHEHVEITPDQIEPLKINRADLPAIEYATIHLDTAFKEDAAKRRTAGDRNVIACWLHDLRPNGIVYLDHISCSDKWRQEEFETELVRLLTQYRSRGIHVRLITDEKEIGGKQGMYRKHLEVLIGRAGLRIPEILQLSRSGKNKLVRIRKSLGYWLEGYVRLVRDVPNLNILIGEVTGLNYNNHDDVADACADVFATDVWRPPLDFRGDDQPALPRQPGDEFLKGWERDMATIEQELRYRPRESDMDEPQPFTEYMERQGA